MKKYDSEHLELQDQGHLWTAFMCGRRPGHLRLGFSGAEHLISLMHKELPRYSADHPGLVRAV